MDADPAKTGTGDCTVGQTGAVTADRPTDDRDTLARIHDLVAEERELRTRLQHHQIDAGEEQARLSALEAELDQCWDLLRQRRALRSSGTDPGDAEVRPVGEVEGYTG